MTATPPISRASPIRPPTHANTIPMRRPALQLDRRSGGDPASVRGGCSGILVITSRPTISGTCRRLSGDLPAAILGLRLDGWRDLAVQLGAGRAFFACGRSAAPSTVSLLDPVATVAVQAQV